MNISLIGLYTDQLVNYLNRGVIGRAIDSGKINLNARQLRDFSDPPHHKVDDYPFSNRKGMLIKYDVLKKALNQSSKNTTFVMPDPSGPIFNYKDAKALSLKEDITFISPAFEGVDARIFESFSIHRFSVGDFILPNGDTPILLMVETILRYLPGVLGSIDCIEDDSILSGLLESPQFCAPRSIDQMDVPEVLLSGHHQEIDRWKTKQSLKRTLYCRPDLINDFSFSQTLVNIIDQVILEDTQ